MLLIYMIDCTADIMVDDGNVFVMWDTLNISEIDLLLNFFVFLLFYN